MSITLDTNLYLLKDKLNISTSRLVEYTSKTVEEIVEAEAEQGNVQAANYGSELFSDANLLVKMFKLADVNNKYRIFSQMSSEQLQEMLPLLEKDDLTIGLNYFTQEKLMSLLECLPREQLASTALELYQPEDLLKLIPDKQLTKFLTSEELDKNTVLKHMQSLNPEYLAQMLEATTGETVEDSDPAALTNQLAQLNPLQYKAALANLNEDAKRELILNITQEDTDKWQLFDAEAFIAPINLKQKPDIVQATNVIDKDEILKMIGELPKDFVAAIMTQMDPDVMAEELINNYPEILAQIAAG